MKKMRILSAILCVCMLFSVTAFAASVDTTSTGVPTGSTTIVTPSAPSGAETPSTPDTPSGAETPTTPSTVPTGDETPTNPSAPTDTPTDPSAPTTEPTTEPTVVPTQPTTEPTQPTTEPTQPTTEPTQPTTEPTQPTTEPTQPTTEPTQPTTEPTQPTTEPTQPTTEPTQPTTEPTQPTTEPTEPTTEPTEPTTEPTEPTTEPTEPTQPSEPTEPAVVLPFTDVAEDAWYYDAVSYCYSNGLMLGVTPTTFAPNMNLTRAMMVMILYRIDGCNKVSTPCAFKDVNQNAWYADAVNWAAANKITLGTSATTFDPNMAITREMMMTMFYRYYQVKAGATAASSDSMAKFADANQVSSWAVEGVSWCVENGLVLGMTDTAIQPQATSTRAQAAQILARA